MFLCPCILVGKIKALITHFRIQATLHKSAYNTNITSQCQYWTKLSTDTVVLGYSVNGFVKCSITSCKLLIKNSYLRVIVAYLYRKRLVGQIQNALMADSGILRVDTLLQKHYADTWKRCGPNVYMGNVCIAHIINVLLFHYSSKSLFTSVHIFKKP